MMNFLYIIAIILIFGKAVRVVPIEIPVPVYFGIFLLIGVVYLFKKPKFSAWSIFFLLVAFLSLIINLNTIAAYMNPWLRLGTFAVLLLGVGPVLRGTRIDKSREKLFNWIFYVLVVFVVLSFVAYVVKFPLAYQYSRGGYLLFTGAFSSGMTLSPMASIASLFVLHKLMNTTAKKWKIFFSIILSLCVLVVFIGASRGAIGALFVGILLYIYFYYLGHFRKLFKFIFIVTVLLFATSFMWISYLDNVLLKQQQRLEGGDIYAGRDQMWLDRVEEFGYHPILGIGFGNVLITKNSIINDDTGSIESGSGWLSLLSNLGILGFISFCALVFGRFRYLFKFAREKNYDFIFYCSLIVFFSIHSLIEGYIFGVGGPICLMFWMSIAMINQEKFKYNNIKSRQYELE